MLEGKGPFFLLSTLFFKGVAIPTCCNFHNEQERIIVLVYLWKITSVCNVETSFVVFTFNNDFEYERY